MPTHRRGDPKPIEFIFEETPLQLFGNLRKVLKLDGGGKLDHFEKKARTYAAAAGISLSDSQALLMAKVIYDHEDARITAMRVSMGKRIVPLEMLLRKFDKPIKKIISINMRIFQSKLNSYLKKTNSHGNKFDSAQERDRAECEAGISCNWIEPECPND